MSYNSNGYIRYSRLDESAIDHLALSQALADY